MKKYLILVFSFTYYTLYCQDTDSIDEKEVAGIINVLASDSFRGRGNYSPHLIMATDFISKKFREYGLKPFPGHIDYVQPFQAASKSIQRDLLHWNDRLLNANQFLFLNEELMIATKQLSDFTVIEITTALADSILLKHWNGSKPVLLWIRKSIPWDELISTYNILLPDALPNAEILIVAEPEIPAAITVKRNPAYVQSVLFNVVGVLPGKSKANESVIFSAHYDHLGTEKRKRGDSIFNGANDNASGTTAVLTLAKYFAMRNDNERTLIFCAFAGEELGLTGSRLFVRNIDVANTKAVFNIEMIGRQARKNTFFITGEEHSDLGKMIRKNLNKNEVKIIPDPSPESNLFIRSDNFPFALEGIAAHTIMGSGDDEICYHKQCDEVSRIDISAMVRIIRAIGEGSKTVISGQDTPKRISKNVF